jgi:hypothetical protein
VPSTFTRTTSSPAHITALTDGQWYQTVGRAYVFINPALGDVAGNRAYGPDTAITLPYQPAATTVTTYTETTTYDETTTYA